MSTTPSLNAFLARSHAALHGQLAAQERERQETPPLTIHLVMGNEAADPDSCVCAIALAAALDVAHQGGGDAIFAPVIAVPRADFKLQLDRVHLLRRAGLVGAGEGPNWTPTHVSFADEIFERYACAADAPLLRLHLVDHNKLSASLAHLAPSVRSIVDHHEDEALYAETVPAAERVVELGIGSCASLVVERLRDLAPSLLDDAAVASLLLGALILDTVNLDPTAKAQKPREAPLAAELLQSASHALGVAPTAEGRGAFFEELMEVKADAALLLAFPTADLLRQDYKQEGMGAGGQVGVGVASVVLPLPPLLARQSFAELAAECEAFATSRGLRALLLMSVDLPQRQRYLLLLCNDPALRESILRALDEGGLQLAPVEAGPALRAFTVGNYKVSRKVLLPILRAAL